MKVSIIITSYNLRAFILEAINSLLAQDCNFPFEIIVIDDASTDGSQEAIASINDPRVIFIPLEKNVGAAAAINIAWAKCTGEYLCRFDGDDRWHPSYLRRTAQLLDEHPDVVLVHTDVSFIDGNGVVTSERHNIPRPAELKPIDHEFTSILEKYYMNAPAIMARKSAWDRVLPWQDRFRTGLGDWYNSLRMVEGRLSAFIDEPLAQYRIHTTNMHRAMIRDRSAEANTNWILDQFRSSHPEIAKKDWDRICYKQYAHLGNAYFFHGMDVDARRCLTLALRHHPSSLTDASFMRIWMASVIGKSRYEKMKSWLPKRA